MALHGTLIGIVVTSAGVVIGADSAVTGNNVPLDMQTVPKLCRTGVASIATIQGRYRMQSTLAGAAYLYERFKARCHEWETAEKTPVLAEQADLLIEDLREELAGFLDRNGTAQCPADMNNDPHLVYVTAAGLDGGTGKAIVTELRTSLDERGQCVLETSRLTTAVVSRQSVTGCGVKFHGEDLVASALLGEQPDSRMDASDWNGPAGRLARQASSQNCSGITLERGRELLLTFFGDTMKYGRAFGIAAGAVGGDLQIATIASGKEPHIETLKPEAWTMSASPGVR